MSVTIYYCPECMQKISENDYCEYCCWDAHRDGGKAVKVKVSDKPVQMFMQPSQGSSFSQNQAH